MGECVLTIAGGSDSGASAGYVSRKKVVSLKLDVLGEILNFQIEVGKERAKMADIVPIARTLCDKITDIVVSKSFDEGNHVPCSRGCSTCCERCLVPVSVPEALRFKEEIDKAPAHRRETIWRDCLRASRLILSQKLPKSFIYQTEASPSDPVDLNLVSNWYTNLKLTCPFLRKSVCSVYEQRPLACREHFITGSVRGCKGLRGAAEVLDIPVQLPNVLGQLASELEETCVEAVILPLVPVWCEDNPGRAERNWPAEMMVARFVEIIEAMAKRKLPKFESRGRTIIGFSEKHRAANQLCRL